MPFGSGTSTGSGSSGRESNSSQQSGNRSQNQSQSGGQGGGRGGGSTSSSGGSLGSSVSSGVQYMTRLPATWCHGIRQALSSQPQGSAVQSNTTNISGQSTGQGVDVRHGAVRSAGGGAGGHGQRGDDGRRRENAFFKDGTENENPFPVIYNPNVPNDGAGYTDHHFFDTLGDPRNPHGSLEQRTEQEYLLQNMVKGGLYEAAKIAHENQIGIAVRGTGLLAHQGIESGNPTKAQEFKNKTSKEMDLWLSDELSFGDVGAVVHYDPRVGWHSSGSNLPPFPKRTEQNKDEWDREAEKEWLKKRQYIETQRKLALLSDLTGKSPRLKFPSSDAEWAKLKDWFKSRLAEFAEENDEYTSPNGHFTGTTLLKGPFIHLKQRPDDHIYGDHDLFGFTDPSTGKLILDSQIKNGMSTQKALQDADTFQAQHGGIWNWQPQQDFHKGIKDKIVGAHSAPNGEPLVYVRPDGVVVAAFYDAATDTIVPVWDRPDAKEWLKSTHSGKELLKR